MKIFGEKILLSNNNKYRKIQELIIAFNLKNFTCVTKNSKIYSILIISLLLASSYFIMSDSLLNSYHFNKIINKKFIPNTYRIVFVFGTRPEAIKLFPLIKKLKENKQFICITINTGQHKEMIQQILNSIYIDSSIDFNLNIMKKNQSLSKLTSKAISNLENLYNLINPSAVVVQGDTTTSLSAAVAAFYLKIPIFHVEAGLRTNNLYYPFPEEFNRITIDDISTLYFAPTNWSANNLLKENKKSSHIFITGNTIVDSLKLTLNKTNPSKIIKKLIEKAKLLCKPKEECKIILLTCHRRENYFQPIINILKAVQQLLKDFNDIAIIFPFHLNPNVRQSIKEAIPKFLYDDIVNGKKIENNNYFHLNRLFIIPPLNYVDLIHLESASYFIMSDSGGIQEEAVSIGKQILILRENTERPEGVMAGYAFLAGTSFSKIYHYSSQLLRNKYLSQNISKFSNIYGNGNASGIISEIIENYFKEKNENLLSHNSSFFDNILSRYDDSLFENDNSNFNDFQKDVYDIVIILTVWKRNNIERQLNQVKSQSILKNKRTNIIIFQNSNHLNIEHIVNEWKKPNKFSDKVNITFIHSPIETGYFGRFIIPLTSSVNSNSYFFICDDDIIWGNKYFENMARVVNEGHLATRNGRIITHNFKEIIIPKIKNKQICYNDDIEYDFGGHIWCGRISWLRKAWNHIPFSFENSEDFWLSAVLKTFYNITTKIPKCPCPEGNPIVPDLCAASDKSAAKHESAKLGDSKISGNIRMKLIKEITNKFNYQLLILSNPNYAKNIKKKYFYSDKFFNLSDNLWKEALFWQ